MLMAAQKREKPTGRESVGFSKIVSDAMTTGKIFFVRLGQSCQTLTAHPIEWVVGVFAFLGGLSNVIG